MRDESEVGMDWIDEEYSKRRSGRTHALTQGQHAAVNGRYPGCTLEYCCECGNPTGFAGKYEDSLYIEDRGPFCSECFDIASREMARCSVARRRISHEKV